MAEASVSGIKLKEKLTGACGLILRKAKGLYKRGDYEGALMYYNKGITLQPHSSDFQQGVLKSEAAIEKSKAKAQEKQQKKNETETESTRKAQNDVTKDKTAEKANDKDSFLPDINLPSRYPKENQTGKDTVAPLLEKKVKQYPNLNPKSVFLLEKGIALYKNQEYDLALKFFSAGKRINPLSEEFNLYTSVTEKKLSKENLKRKERIATMPPPLPKETQTELACSRSTTVQELEEVFSYRHRYLLTRAENCYNHGDFQGSYAFCEKGLQLQPKSKVFQRAKEKAHDGILISLGLKSPTGEMAQKFIVVELVKAEQYMNDKDYTSAIEQCKDTITSVKEMPLQKIPDKESLLATGLSILGNCYIYTEDYQKALFYHSEDLDIGKMINNNDIKSRALTNVGRVYVKMKKYQEALQVWLQNFEMGIENSGERSWQCHEIGQCYIELEDYEKAIEFGQHALSAAKAADIDKKKIEASTLIGQAALRGGSIGVSKRALEQALNYAKKTGDKEVISSLKPVLKELYKYLNEENKIDEADDEEDDWGYVPTQNKQTTSEALLRL